MAKKLVDGHPIHTEDISQSETSLLPSDLEAAMAKMDNVQKAAVERQRNVEAHNNTMLRSNEFIDNRALVGGNILVRLFLKDAVKPNLLGEGFIPVDNKFTFESNGRSFTVNDPLPYVYEGVIIKHDASLSERYPWMKPGVIVQIKPCELQNFVYYADKRNERKQITGKELLEGVELNDFDSLFLITTNMIDSFEEIPYEDKAKRLS